GRPNVGKSSLINSIVKSECAIVSELAGTTRDAVDIAYQRDGERFVFIDTAGIRKRSKHSTSVEVFSVMRAERSIRRADLCVLIVDLISGVTAQDKKIAGLIQRVRGAAKARIGTGVLNRLLRTAFDANPPPMMKGRRLKLFYATQPPRSQDRELTPPEFVLFVNDPHLLNQTYRRYLEARIR